MKKIILPIAFLGLFACNNAAETETNNEEQNDTTQVAEETIEIEKFGEEITEDGAMTGVEFLQAFQGKDSLEAKVEAPIVEVCQKKGCWMELQLTENDKMTIRFKDYGFFVPKDASGKTAIVEGVAKIDTISVTELKHYAEDAGASQAAIDSITEPEVVMELIAKGVIIKE